ncbi:MAG: hypothetical protein HY738_08155 [Bacteroidia bacterium]|nr:hypothetical protein [Bacteroidia bacterium]
MKNKKLLLYQALELRNFIDSHIGLLKRCISDRSKNSSYGDSSSKYADDFKLSDVKDKFKNLEIKRKKLNIAIQKTNFESNVEFDGGNMNIAEVLELRKGYKTEIENLIKQTSDSSSVNIIHKEDRDIIEKNEISFTESYKEFLDIRNKFYEINCLLKEAALKFEVDFIDE